MRVHDPLLAALDAFIADWPEKLSRPQALRMLLADQLTGLGHLKEKP
ncbi:MAG: hypothetical protein ABJP31_06710 [Bauldia litoralis]